MNHTLIQYSGPFAQFASLTGSPLWGMSIEAVIEAWVNRGWKLISRSRPNTIYGIGPEVVNFKTSTGRSIIWIPSYGGVANEDFLGNNSQEKVFWILWQAGVKVLLVGGTSGITDFKDDNDAIHPGDLVFPWSFRTSASHRGLPGTDFETFWPQLDVTMGDPFCTDMSQLLNLQAQKHIGPHGIRKIHTPKDVRVALVIPDGVTFETDFDILMWLSIASKITEMQPNRPRVAILHGDCINPLLARALGIHLAYYHMVANYAQGLGEEIVDTLYRLYLGNFANVAIDMEWNFLNNTSAPTGEKCICVTSVHKAPKVFAEAMTNE